MPLAERLLLALCGSPHAADYLSSDDTITVENALLPLYREFGKDEFLTRIRDRHVLDYGCGFGWHSVAYLRNGASEVSCVDIGEANVAHTRALAERYGVSDRLHTYLGDIDEISLPAGTFDLAITVNTFEHFLDPGGILRVCRPALRTGGKMLITFGPPWLHPFGSHMNHFTRVPWVHLLFSERTVMKVRENFRDDGASRYSEVEGGLNQMTVRNFLRLAREIEFDVEYLQLRGLKQMHILTRLPGIREFLTNRINCILVKP